MTIEQRASEYQSKLASSFLGCPDLLEGGYNGYIVGATDQQKIDSDVLKDCFVFTKEQLCEYNKINYSIYKKQSIKKLKEVMNRLMLDTKDKAEIIKIMEEA